MKYKNGQKLIEFEKNQEMYVYMCIIWMIFHFCEFKSNNFSGVIYVLTQVLFAFIVISEEP